MIIKLNKFAIAELDKESIMLKQYYDNRNGNAVMVKFELKKFYDKFEDAPIFVGVTSSEPRKNRDTTGNKIRLRKGENFPLYYVSSIDAVKDLSLIFEIQTNHANELEQFGSIKVYPHGKNEKYKFVESRIDPKRFNTNKYRSTGHRTNPFGIKSSTVEEINVGPRQHHQSSFGVDDQMSPAKIEKLKRQMGLTDDLLMQRLGLTDEALRMRLGLTDELIQNFIDTAVNMVRENLGITEEVLHILSFNTQQYSMDIQRLKTTIDKFKNETHLIRTTIEKMNIPGLEKDYKYIEKRYDWAKLRCEQLERTFANQTDELTEQLREKNDALDQVLQDFLDWTDEKRQTIQTELDKVLEFQHRYSEAIQNMDNLKTSCSHLQMVDPFERARSAANRLYDILNQDKNITLKSIKQKFPQDLQERMQMILQLEDMVDKLLPSEMSEQSAFDIASEIQTIKDKFLPIRNRYIFNPPILLETATGFADKIEHISYLDIEEETRLKEQSQLESGPWKSLDPLQIYQERVDFHLETLRKQYMNEKETTMAEMFDSEKQLSEALNTFIETDLFDFIENKLPVIEEKYAHMTATEKPSPEYLNDSRNNLLSIGNIQEIDVVSEKDLFNPEIHQLKKAGHNNDLPDQVVLEILSKGYRLGVVGPILKKVDVAINSTG